MNMLRKWKDPNLSHQNVISTMHRSCHNNLNERVQIGRPWGIKEEIRNVSRLGDDLSPLSRSVMVDDGKKRSILRYDVISG
jgi:hypothetical protein